MTKFPHRNNKFKNLATFLIVSVTLIFLANCKDWPFKGGGPIVDGLDAYSCGV
jgi:hypothetical protein